MPPRKGFLPKCVNQDPWDPSDKNSIQTKLSKREGYTGRVPRILQCCFFELGTPLLQAPLNGFLQPRGTCECIPLASQSLPDLPPHSHSLILSLPLHRPGLCPCCALHLGYVSPSSFPAVSGSPSPSASAHCHLFRETFPFPSHLGSSQGSLSPPPAMFPGHIRSEMTRVLTCLLSVSPLDGPPRTALWIAHWAIPDIQRSTPRHECSINICGMITWLTVILHALSKSGFLCLKFSVSLQTRPSCFSQLEATDPPGL